MLAGLIAGFIVLNSVMWVNFYLSRDKPNARKRVVVVDLICLVVAVGMAGFVVGSTH